MRRNNEMSIGDTTSGRTLKKQLVSSPTEPRFLIGDQVVVKNFMMHGTNAGDVTMDVINRATMSYEDTGKRVDKIQLENESLKFRGWFPMYSRRIELVANQ